jgi:hypothetical protein
MNEKSLHEYYKRFKKLYAIILKAIKQLIPSMAANTQQFGTRIDTPIDMLMR